MGSLRDELFKANLLSKKDVQKIRQDERKDKKTLGREALAEKKQADEEKRKREEEARRERDRRREADRQAGRAREEVRAQVRDLALSGSLKERTSGPRRFYFVTRKGRVPFLEVSHEIGAALEEGRVAIVEVPNRSGPTGFALVPRETADRMAALDPESVRFLNK